MEVKVIPDLGIDRRCLTYGRAVPGQETRIIPASDRK
jgi:hypothetical protein